MENMENKITVIDENGEEMLCEVLFTFESDEFGKSYVLYAPIGSEDEDGEVNVLASSFIEKDGEAGELMPIETEAEWDLIEEMFNTFFSEGEEE